MTQDELKSILLKHNQALEYMGEMLVMIAARIDRLTAALNGHPGITVAMEAAEREGGGG